MSKTKFYVTTGDASEPHRLRQVVHSENPRRAVLWAIRLSLQEGEHVTIGKFVRVSETGFYDDGDCDENAVVFLSEEFFLSDCAQFS